RPHPARRQTGRASCPGSDQIRNSRQRQNRERARPDGAAGSARGRRPGDRISRDVRFSLAAAQIEAMEATMMLFALFLFVSLLGAPVHLVAEEAVERRGITSAVKLEEVVFSHITELNGKYKMRATEVTFAPGGYLGVHHHVGPGIRYVLSGELTFTEGGQA